MKNKNILWLYLFMLVSILDILFTANGQTDQRVFTKPLIIPFLLGYFFFSTSFFRGQLLRKTIIAALIFSWLGDTLLMFPKMFLYGLGAFLMAHICYIIGFKVAQKQPFRVGKVDFIRLFFLNFPIYLFAAFVYFFIRNGLGEMKIPVVAYLIVIVMMATTARERFKNTNEISFWQVMIGAAFFLVSDGILAVNMFSNTFQEAGVLVMGTYVIAQFLIVRGILAHIVELKAG
ncbi:lysoplasmalogenase [Cecembia sp.]|uniref:lysoplasmalogenase n=1 Tax=Cecembia sp. TaxID=1898110 RepID=UPI0025C2C7D2|nr:lysoplasmalogenase [Cecembia sp.]